MHELYQTYGSGDLKANPNQAFKMADAGPVVLLSRTQPKAVLVSPEMWNDIARELNDLRALVAAFRAEQDLSNPNAWTIEHETDTVSA